MRNSGQRHAPRSRRWLALGGGSVGAFSRVGALLLTLSTMGWFAALATPAAQARQKHEIKLTIVENQISTTNPNPAGPPRVGTTTVHAGIASLTGGGRGAVVDKVTITSLSLATFTATFRGTATFFFFSGTLSAKSVGRATIHKDGSVTFRGTTTFTSGTGAYKGVSGHLTFTGGSRSKPGSVTTFQLAGTAIY